MKKVIIFKMLTLGYIVLMTSCVYYPQMVDVPLIREKNDLKVDAGISLVPAAHATVSYGLTDIISVQAAGSINVRYDNHIGNYFQGAIGTFKNRNNHIMELYGGFGYGYAYSKPPEINVDDPDDFKEIFKGNYQQYFGQFNYGFVGKKNFEYGFGLKTGTLHFDMMHSDKYNAREEIMIPKKYKEWGLFVEPIAFIRTGGEKLKFDLKLSGCWLEMLTNRNIKPFYSPINIGFGVNYNF